MSRGNDLFIYLFLECFAMERTASVGKQMFKRSENCEVTLVQLELRVVVQLGIDAILIDYILQILQERLCSFFLNSYFKICH